MFATSTSSYYMQDGNQADSFPNGDHAIGGGMYVHMDNGCTVCHVHTNNPQVITIPGPGGVPIPVPFIGGGMESADANVASSKPKVLNLKPTPETVAGLQITSYKYGSSKKPQQMKLKSSSIKLSNIKKVDDPTVEPLSADEMPDTRFIFSDQGGHHWYLYTISKNHEVVLTHTPNTPCESAPGTTYAELVGEENVYLQQKGGEQVYTADLHVRFEVDDPDQEFMEEYKKCY